MWTLLIACSGTPSGTRADAPPMGITSEFPALPAGQPVAIPLHRTPGTWDLGDVAGPKVGVGEDYEIVVEPVGAKAAKANAPRSFRGELPFPVSEEDARFKPTDMDVFVDGQQAVYARQPNSRPGRTSWRVQLGKLFLSHKGDAPRVEVRYPGVRRALQRHDPKACGLEGDAFGRYDLTLAGTTRQGLTLPAGTKVSWEVTIPKDQPRFESFVALEAPPLQGATSDGASVVALIEVDGTTAEVARYQVAAATDAFSRWSFDLAAWAGKTVRLHLRTEPGPTPDWDWVFVGAPAVLGAQTSTPRRVVLVAFDTTRPDRIGFGGYAKGATPELDAIARSSVVLTSTWSQAPRTRPSFRAATTGRLPLEAVGEPNIGERFATAGWATAGFVANVHLQPRFDFHRGYDEWTYTGEEIAEVQVDRALTWLQAHADRDALLFLHFMDPHLPYKAPGEFEQRFVTTPTPELETFERADIVARTKGNDLSDDDMAEIQARHDGEMAYLSSQMDRLVSALDALPGDGMSVLFSDHGEEFWEHGGFEHNHSLYDEVVRTVLWFRPEGGMKPGHAVATPASLVDIVPTVLDLAGLPAAPHSEGVSLRPLLAGGSAPPQFDRPLALGHLQYGVQRWGVVWNRHKYVVYTHSGRQQLFDLVNDPTESTDLSATADLAPYVDALIQAHTPNGESAFPKLDAGPGWRIRVTLAGSSAPIRIAMPAQPLAAGVLDPESAKESPANQEWGEEPEITVDQVGTVQLSEDRRMLEFQPGSHGEGTVWVRFEAATPASAESVQRGNDTLTLAPGPKGNPRWEAGGEKIVIEPGTVVVPPAGEWARMVALRGLQAVSDADRAELIRLGYLEPDRADP